MALGFHLYKCSSYVLVYWHGDFVMKLEIRDHKIRGDDSWVYDGSIRSVKYLTMVAERIAYNHNVKRIYLRK